MRPTHFLLDGITTYIHSGYNDGPGWPVPRMHDFITLGLVSGPQRYRVQAIEWEYPETPYLTGEHRCGEPIITVHLRRLRPGELGNIGEPTGYDYEEQ